MTHSRCMRGPARAGRMFAGTAGSVEVTGLFDFVQDAREALAIMADSPFLHVRSSKLRVMPGEEDELVNEGTYGKACAYYLQSNLVRMGYTVSQAVCEDWGWWVGVKGSADTLGIGVYGMRIDDTDDLDLCVTVLVPRGRRWSWRRLRWIDTTAEVDRLHQAMRSVFEADQDITVIGEFSDLPLG